MDTVVEKQKIAIIPARGGSKRIPGKNRVEFLGMPMIAHTIIAARDSEQFDNIVVSTDDELIAETAVKYGAEVPFLREEHTDDHAPISLATINTLNRLENENGKIYATVVQLMANCPLRDSADIQSACTFFENNPHHFQISCFKYGWMNPWWAHSLDKNRIAKPVFDQEMRMRRSQDQPDLYCPTGAIWIADIAELKKANTFYGKDYRFYPLDWKHALDIDDYDDLEMGKLLGR